MQLFNAEAILFSKKNQFFFDPEDMKERSQKLLIIGPQLFQCSGPAAQTTQKQKSLTTKSLILQD